MLRAGSRAKPWPKRRACSRSRMKQKKASAFVGHDVGIAPRRPRTSDRCPSLAFEPHRGRDDRGDHRNRSYSDSHLPYLAVHKCQDDRVDEVIEHTDHSTPRPTTAAAAWIAGAATVTRIHGAARRMTG